MQWLISLFLSTALATNGLSTYTIPMAHANAAWQGVAKIGEQYYVSSDRDEAFKLRNSISVYTDRGFVKRKFYNFTQWSFGDINYTGGGLYGTLYNFNAHITPYESRAVKIDPVTLNITKIWKIGGSVAEAVVYHKGYWWVGYHNRKLVRRFSAGFTAPKDYPFFDSYPNSNRVQGMFFLNGLLYVQRHANFGKGWHDPAPGMDRYYFRNGGYDYKDTLRPMTPGTGQGVEYVAGTVIQNDRQANTIEHTTLTSLVK